MQGQPVKILLIDDDEDDFIITSSLLTESAESQFQFEWASTYEDALDLILQGRHDVYLVDYNLGERTGLELLREALAKGCQSPIILLTGQGGHHLDIEAMRSGRLHSTAYSTCSVPFAVNLAGAVPFAAMGDDKGAAGYHLIVIAQAGNAKIDSVADLKGKRVAHVSQTSNSGHQAPVYFFSKMGVVPEKDYEIAFTGKHDNSILGVVNGDYDAAAVANTVLERMVNRGVVKKTDYKIIYASALFPVAGWSYAHNLDPRLAEKIREAFFTFKIQGSSVAKEWKTYTRFVPVTYRKDWEAVAGILEANGVVFTKDSPDYKKLSKPPAKGE
jgi:phosphate/phosphite/phosphonate ABC transporter binding protein